MRFSNSLRNVSLIPQCLGLRKYSELLFYACKISLQNSSFFITSKILCFRINLIRVYKYPVFLDALYGITYLFSRTGFRICFSISKHQSSKTLYRQQFFTNFVEVELCKESSVLDPHRVNESK